MTKDCCVWIKRKKGNAAHQPTFNGVPKPLVINNCLIVSFSRLNSEHNED